MSEFQDRRCQLCSRSRPRWRCSLLPSPPSRVKHARIFNRSHTKPTTYLSRAVRLCDDSASQVLPRSPRHLAHRGPLPRRIVEDVGVCDICLRLRVPSRQEEPALVDDGQAGIGVGRGERGKLLNVDSVQSAVNAAKPSYFMCI